MVHIAYGDNSQGVYGDDAYGDLPGILYVDSTILPNDYLFVGAAGGGIYGDDPTYDTAGGGRLLSIIFVTPRLT